MDYKNLKPYLSDVLNSDTYEIFNNWGIKEKKYCILIPTFQRRKLLKCSLESAINQERYDNYEIFVLDNNPERNDDTELMMLEYREVPNLRYCKNVQNIGGTGNCNKLCLMARTEWLIMLHDDDMLYPDFMVNMDRIVSMKKQCATFFTIDSYVNNDTSNKPIRNDNEKILITRLKVGDFMLWNIAGNPVGMTFKRDIAIRYQLFNPEYIPANDMNLDVQIVRDYPTYLLRGYPLSCYRVFDNDTFRSGVGEGIVKMHKTIREKLFRDSFGYFPAFFAKKFLNTQEFLTLDKHWHKDTSELSPISSVDIIIYKIIRFYFNLKRKIRYIYSQKVCHV